MMMMMMEHSARRTGIAGNRLLACHRSTVVDRRMRQWKKKKTVLCFL